jgi:hypothetical protein
MSTEQKDFKIGEYISEPLFLKFTRKKSNVISSV